MKHTKSDSEIAVENNLFRVRYKFDNPNFFEIDFKTFTQHFFIPSSCDSLGKTDLIKKLIQFSSNDNGDIFQFRFEYESSLWNKVYYLDIYPDRAEYYYELHGEGDIDTLRYFEGTFEEGYEEDFYLTKHFNDKLTTPYRNYSQASPVNFSTLFNPEANSYSKQYFDFFERSQISVNSDLDYCGGNFVFNPGIFCHLLSQDKKTEWVSLGLAVLPGEHHFSEYEYIGGTHFGLNLNYWGLFSIKGNFTSPKIVITTGTNEEETLKRYISILVSNKLVDLRKKDRKPWWNGPMVCGWGHQSYMGDLFRIRSPRERQKDEAVYYMCTQANYESLVQSLDSRNLNWKILIIDSKWFINGGLKIVDEGRWSNMRGFVDELHRRGKKVLLWWAPWNPEGFPAEECITYSEKETKGKPNRPGRFAKYGPISDGAKLAPDITLASVENRIKASLRKILGSEPNEYGFDGLKIDHVAGTPGMYGLKFPQSSRRLFGIELLKYYYDLLYAEAKIINPECLIIGQSPNPYFANCFDMMRLGDIYTHKRRSVNAEMIFRAKMAKIANPNWLIDMDGWPLPSLEAFNKYMGLQAQYGVPSLYYATNLDTTGEKISNEDFEAIRKNWEEYSAENNTDQS